MDYVTPTPCNNRISVNKNSSVKGFMLQNTKLIRTCALAAVIVFFAAAPSRAETAAALAGNHPDAAADLLMTGTAPATYQPLQMEIYLKPRNQAQLDQLLQDQQDPTSPQYHKFLTPTEYDQQFGPTDADVADVSSWLKSQGFSVTHASAHDGRVAFSGDVATAQSAFSVQISASQDGKSFGNVNDPQLPASLAAKISHLSGLDNLHGTAWNAVIDDPPFNNESGSTAPFFGPNDIRAFNDEKPLLTASPTNLDGTGQCIALSEGSDVDQASLGEFNTIFGLPAFVPGANYFSVFPDGSPGTPGSLGSGHAYTEAVLDAEYAHGIAPGASIVLYAANAGSETGDSVTPLVDSLKAAVSDSGRLCASVAVSWAQCGLPVSFYQMLDTIFAQGASEGQSIFVATGDVGTAASKLGSCLVPPKPASANIEENAGSPHVTAVGASMFQATYDSNGNVTSTLANTKQTPWDFSRKSPKLTILQAFGATTGGYSKIFPLPIWQKGVAGIAGKFRAVPDLVLGGGNLGGQETISEKGNTLKFTGSIAPSPNFWECFDAGLANGGAALGYECATTGGTSIVPPQYAGLLAIIVQKSAKRQGLINPQLYAMAQANLKNPAAVGLVDITTGNDAYPPVAGKAAKKNYDLASGWGSVDMTNFVNSFISFVPPPPKIKK